QNDLHQASRSRGAGKIIALLRVACRTRRCHSDTAAGCVAKVPQVMPEGECALAVASPGEGALEGAMSGNV
ncbi:MAG TPA: hypothetical protein DCQ70_13635, partial [Halieaceae bacterium]|nr:hypothetical protein [Halieaceae bacterium]